MQEKIDRDLKAALLGGDKPKVEVLRGLKSAILNEAIAKNSRENGLREDQLQVVLVREAKKRTDAIELYDKVGEVQRAAAERSEKAIIEQYLPQQLSEAEITDAVSQELATLDNPTMSDMGKVIGAVKAKLGASADGAIIARLVKEKIQL